jgi:hypothetical protein
MYYVHTICYILHADESIPFKESTKHQVGLQSVRAIRHSSVFNSCNGLMIDDTKFRVVVDGNNAWADGKFILKSI